MIRRVLSTPPAAAAATVHRAVPAEGARARPGVGGAGLEDDIEVGAGALAGLDLGQRHHHVPIRVPPAGRR
eukprot:CAMPEP_0172157122 /NCGR_PEP_ID=MMETSP1050-20130122/3606_1 /TAXON_ID=233186 /ORGANISM="Cryptomonas curvata, Strain CCAP979/52" /LENGTH=70 /DNA_ID=CAMNT_0012826297 /DNA_START=165 /DNA_END=375 /DNA_ORIENTATION=-